MRFSVPGLFLSHAEKKSLAARVADFEKKSDCELVFHVRRHFAKPDALEATRDLFFQMGLEKTQRRTGILIALALVDHKFAIWVDDGVKRRSDDELFKRVCQSMTVALKSGLRLEAFTNAIDELEKKLELEHPALEQNPNELPDDPIIH